MSYHIPQQVQEACGEARRLASVRVVCPELVPDVPLTRLEGLWGSIVVDAEPRFYMLSFNNGGLPGGKRHWITGGGKASVVEQWILTDHMNEVKGDPRLVRTLSRRGAARRDLSLSAISGRRPQRRPLGRIRSRRRRDRVRLAA